MSPKSCERALIVTGASGGHIFPALAFLDKLKNKKQVDTLLILPKTSIINHIEEFEGEIKYLPLPRIKLKLMFLVPLELLRLALGSLFTLLEFRPHIVIGFGSLTSVALILFARALGIKTLIHEQNVVPGRANRFLAGFVDRIAISFEETRGYLRRFQPKLRLTGNPVRKGLVRIEKCEALDFFNFSADKFTILVIGGSQGSHRINYGFLRAVSKISLKEKLQIIHLSGAKERESLETSYRDLGINSRVFSFFKPMQLAYSACDLVVSRGGATTIAELIFFGLPAVIVPYPFAYMHQLRNAQVLEKKHAVRIISDGALDSDILSQNIKELMNEPGRIIQMRQQYNNFPKAEPDDLLVNEALSLLARHE